MAETQYNNQAEDTKQNVKAFNHDDSYMYNVMNE